MKDIRLRLFNEKDLDEVVEINRTCLPENYVPYFFMEIYYKCPEGFWVAEDIINNKLVGYCMWRVEKTFSNFSRSFKRVKVAHLISIAVIEKYRRNKIGEQLLLTGIKSMKEKYNVQECYLEVRVTNYPAIKLYEKHNFVKVKILKNYYKDGEDAHLMALNLV